MDFEQKLNMYLVWEYALSREEKAKISSALGYSKTTYCREYLRTEYNNNTKLKKKFIPILQNLYPQEWWNQRLEIAKTELKRLQDRSQLMPDDNDQQEPATSVGRSVSLEHYVVSQGNIIESLKVIHRELGNIIRSLENILNQKD